MHISRIKPYAALLLLLLLTFILTLFYHINHTHISSWDESRHGVSALEMLYNHNYVINTWAGKPDMWNLKPILSFLPTCLSFLILGKSLLAMRFFSILSAGLLICILSYYSFKKYNPYTALICISLLLTASLIIKNHAFRTGDADSFFLLCQTVVILTLSNKNDTRSITLAAFFSALSFLTKSWHALFMGVPYLIAYFYLIKDGKLSIKSVLFPVLSFSLPIILWLSLRYPYDHFTFLREMYEYDLVKRSTNLIADNRHSNWYYIKKLFQHFSVITVTFLFSLIYSFHIRKRKFLTYDIIILLSAILSSLIIYSLAKTKLHWYGYTHVILMAITSAILIGRDIRPYTKIFTIMLAVGAFVYNLHTLKSLSKETTPRYYSMLKTHPYPEFQAIYTPEKITQAERMAFMIMGNFNYDTIKYGKPKQPALVFYRENATDNSDITGCTMISKETLKVENKKRNETILLYSCKPQ